MSIKSFAKNLLIIFAILLMSSSCIVTNTANLSAKGNDIELYATILPERDYNEISYILSEGIIKEHNPQKLLDELKKKAKELGADAVINIEYITKGRQIWAVSGIALKYK